ncbi:MAG: SWIM zinc finger family protein, partial [candidate division WOR-3 bacterium]
MANLKELLTDSALQRLAFGRSYDRGRRYFEDGMVESLSEFGGKLVARVRGAELYAVRLWPEQGLAHECTCPVGADGLFCKHCVAAGLEWLERQADGEPMDDEDMSVRPAHVTLDELRDYLRGLDRETLADVLMRQAEHDPEFAERLTTRAALSRPEGPGKKFLRKAITDATRPHASLYGRATTAFAERVRNSLEPVWALAASGRGDEALELAEHAMNRVIKAMGQVDDSNDGCMGCLLSEVEELHLEACRAARPEPRALARELFNRAVNSDWEVFLRAAETHAEVLGEEGLAEYRRLAEKAWRRLPALKPGQESKDGPYRRPILTMMMQALARTSGDIEELVAVMAKDLSCEYRFLEIAQVYKDAGQDDRALEWAEQGLAAFPDRTDSRLRRFLFEEYLTRVRPKEAMNLAWAEFTDSPYEHKFQELRKSAERIGQWPTWR